ncbi:uncharacterized protein LOC134693371 [Mytilus trossulus]|uniref:uncharacterized protein LOC134693371 n=1 Tax=Mytilus trossulus TaxID=6551 RepID=UPI003005F44D
MMFLLKHDKGFRILDKELPDPIDTSIDADLTRIYFYTQFIVDNTTTKSFDTSAFLEIWDTIVKAIVRIGGDSMQNQCDCLKTEVIGENIKGAMLGLVEIREKMTVLKQKLESDLSKAIKDNKEEEDFNEEVYYKEIDKWLDEDKMFVETKASTSLLAALRNGQKSITVVGSFCVGKTFTTRHVALILRREGYKIHPVSSLDELKKLCVKGHRTLFIVDEFCSGSIIKRGIDIKMWEKMSDDLLGSQSKIVACCSLMLYQHSSFKNARLSFFRSFVLNMNSSYALTSDELHCVAKRHTDIDDTLIQKYSSEFPFFPFHYSKCSLFSKTYKEGKHISKFICHDALFINAMVVYKFQLDTFYTDDKLKYTALALIVQMNNYVEEECFRESRTGKNSVLHQVNTISDSCKFDKKNKDNKSIQLFKSLSDIECELKSMIGSFVIVMTDSKNSLVYSAKNLSVYEMLATYFKEELPEHFSGKFPVHKKCKKLQ